MASEGVPATRVLDQQVNVQVPATLTETVTYYEFVGGQDTGTAQYLGTTVIGGQTFDVWYTSNTVSAPDEEGKFNIGGNSVDPIQQSTWGHDDNYDHPVTKANGFSHNWTEGNRTYTVPVGTNPIGGGFVSGGPNVHLEDASFVDPVVEPIYYPGAIISVSKI